MNLWHRMDGTGWAQVRQEPEDPGLAGDVPAHCRAGLRWPLRVPLSQTILWCWLLGWRHSWYLWPSHSVVSQLWMLSPFHTPVGPNSPLSPGVAADPRRNSLCSISGNPCTTDSIPDRNCAFSLFPHWQRYPSGNHDFLGCPSQGNQIRGAHQQSPQQAELINHYKHIFSLSGCWILSHNLNAHAQPFQGPSSPCDTWGALPSAGTLHCPKISTEKLINGFSLGRGWIMRVHGEKKL